jgi:MFS family permease
MTAGVLISIPSSEKIGRKKLFLVSNTISILGYVLMYFAQSFLVLVTGRTVQCIGMGLGAMTIGVFLSEVSTVKMR